MIKFTRRDYEVIAAVFIPPLGVFLHRGIGFQLLLNIILTLLGFVPGLIHAILLINRPRP